jgi:hypothetical protein
VISWIWLQGYDDLQRDEHGDQLLNKPRAHELQTEDVHKSNISVVQHVNICEAMRWRKPLLFPEE